MSVCGGCCSSDRVLNSVFCLCNKSLCHVVALLCFSCCTQSVSYQTLRLSFLFLFIAYCSSGSRSVMPSTCLTFTSSAIVRNDVPGVLSKEALEITRPWPSVLSAGLRILINREKKKNVYTSLYLHLLIFIEHTEV